MAYSVELRFDEALARQVVGMWQTLADAGISRYMLECAAIPHVSLAVYDDEEAVDPGVLAGLAELLAKGSASQLVTFSSLGVFATSEKRPVSRGGRLACAARAPSGLARPRGRLQLRLPAALSAGPLGPPLHAHDAPANAGPAPGPGGPRLRLGVALRQSLLGRTDPGAPGRDPAPARSRGRAMTRRSSELRRWRRAGGRRRGR